MDPFNQNALQPKVMFTAALIKNEEDSSVGLLNKWNFLLWKVLSYIKVHNKHKNQRHRSQNILKNLIFTADILKNKEKRTQQHRLSVRLNQLEANKSKV